LASTAFSRASVPCRPRRLLEQALRVDLRHAALGDAALAAFVTRAEHVADVFKRQSRAP
jgi:hypothetical protein